MIYPYMTLNDDTEITHSEMKPDGSVIVYIETPDAELGFKHTQCILPSYTWLDTLGYSEEEMKYFQDIVESGAHLILEFAQSGGFLHAANI